MLRTEQFKCQRQQLARRTSCNDVCCYALNWIRQVSNAAATPNNSCNHVCCYAVNRTSRASKAALISDAINSVSPQALSQNPDAWFTFASTFVAIQPPGRLCFYVHYLTRLLFCLYCLQGTSISEEKQEDRPHQLSACMQCKPDACAGVFPSSVHEKVYISEACVMLHASYACLVHTGQCLCCRETLPWALELVHCFEAATTPLNAINMTMITPVQPGLTCSCIAGAWQETPHHFGVTWCLLHNVSGASCNTSHINIAPLTCDKSIECNATVQSSAAKHSH